MVITFYGENCFKFQVGETAVLVDPFDSSKTGLSSPRFKHEVAIKTLSPFPPASAKDEGDAVQIIGPGEYSFKGLEFKGFLLESESTPKFIKTIYLAKLEDLNIALLGHVSGTLSPAIMESLTDIDVLFIPAGGEPFIEQKAAAKLIRQIQPKIVVPALFKIPGLKRNAADIKIFLENFNGGKFAPQEKLVVKKKDLASQTKTQIVLLKI